MNRCTAIYSAFKTGAEIIYGKILGHESIKWPYKTCHLINAHYIIIRSRDLITHEMDVLAAERE